MTGWLAAIAHDVVFLALQFGPVLLWLWWIERHSAAERRFWQSPPRMQDPPPNWPRSVFRILVAIAMVAVGSGLAWTVMGDADAGRREAISRAEEIITAIAARIGL